MGVRDLVDKLPLGNEIVSYFDSWRTGFAGVIRLPPLQRSKICLDGVELGKLGLDFVVGILELLLQHVYDLTKRTVCPVPGRIPLEGSYKAVGGLLKTGCQ